MAVYLIIAGLLGLNGIYHSFQIVQSARDRNSVGSGSGRRRLRRFYFDLIVAASSARFFCHASYSGVPGRGGTSFGIPPSHVGTLSATAPLTAGLGSVVQAGSMQAMATSAGLVALNFITAITRPNHA